MAAAGRGDWRRRSTERSSRTTPTGAVSRGNSGNSCFASDKNEVGILIYAGLFLAEDVDPVRIMRDKDEHGVTITEHRFISPATAGIVWASRPVRLRVDLLRERDHS